MSVKNLVHLCSLFYNEESARPDISICQQIIAGLRKHVSKEGLLGKTVAVIANLKTAKLAGETSEGMILAAVCKGDEYDHGELVRPLQPPGPMPEFSFEPLNVLILSRRPICSK